MSSVFRLHLRSLTPAGPATVVEEVPGDRLAVLICDMWDNHWCSGAARRVAAMAARVDAAVAAARAAGALIVHAPSDTMGFYADSPARLRAQAVPRVQPPAPLPLVEPALPIDDSDGGCDSGEVPWSRVWTRQHPAITIDPARDALSEDGAEVYSLLRAAGSRRLLLLGVHANMCVVGRPFGIRQMVRWGVPCALVRDLTDAMYNPARPPHVDHDSGTALVVQHIERHLCPSVAAADLESAAP